MKEIALATILHDPENRQFEVAKDYLGLLAKYYTNIYIARSEKVHPDFVSKLEDNNCNIAVIQEKVGGSRRACVQAALEEGNEFIHYCDFDRIIH